MILKDRRQVNYAYSTVTDVSSNQKQVLFISYANKSMLMLAVRLFYSESDVKKRKEKRKSDESEERGGFDLSPVRLDFDK